MIPLAEAVPLTDGVVLLDRFTDADVDALLAGEDNHFVRRSSLPGPFTRRDVAGRITHWQNQWQHGGPERSFAVRETGSRRLVGGCALDLRPHDSETAELTYWVFPPYRCRGYATRAVELVCGYAFDVLGIERLEAFIEPTNMASLSVAAKARFVAAKARFGRGVLRGQPARCQDARAGMALFTRFRAADRVARCRASRDLAPSEQATAEPSPGSANGERLRAHIRRMTR